MKLSQIKSNPNNPRVIRDASFEKLKQSILDFPKMMALRPMVVDSDGIVLGGNMRLKALQELGYKEVPDEWVKQASELTEEEKKRFIIADNVGYGEWDMDVLTNEWDVDELQKWGLELSFAANGGGNQDAVDDDFEIPETVKTDIVTGDVIDIGNHRLVCGDCCNTDDMSKLMDSDLADLVVTDPPYNVAYTGKTKDALKIQNDEMTDAGFYQFLLDAFGSLAAYTKQGGSWYVWHADSEGANFRRSMNEAGVKVRQCLVWVKNSMVMGRQDYHWKHEPCLYGWKEGAAHNWYADRKQTTVLEFDRPNRNAEHPTMKPVELIAYQIKNSSKSGEIVLDAFGGSGTTMVASHQLERRARLMEIDPKYCQVIVDRMLKLEPNIVVKINGKQYKN